jgi:amino acid adenylation domain-containing protein
MIEGVNTEAATLVDVLAHHVDRIPDRAAVTDDQRTLTYLELGSATDRLAREVRRACEPSPQPVGVLLGPGVDAVVAIYSVLEAGMIAVPLDPGTPRASRIDVLRHAGVSVVVTDTFGPELAEDGFRAVGVTDTSEHATDRQPRMVSADDAANILYTSGSTGTPKGFVVTHGAQLTSARSWVDIYGLGPSDRVALTFHPSFGAARVSLYGALVAGAELRVFDAPRVGPGGIATALADDAITFAHCGATLLRSVLLQLPDGPNYPQLRVLAVGAESLHPRDVTRFRARVSSDCTLAYTYAVSEVGPVSALFIDARTALDEELLPVGRPLPGQHVSIADPDRTGVGEIVVTGEGIASGYWNDEGRTAERFGVDPMNPAARTFRTGDRGRVRSDGMLEYRGRGDTRVKVRGYGLDLADVERTLLAIAPITEVAVVVERRRRDRLVAYVVPDPTLPAETPARYRRLLAARLPTYMIPGAFVTMDALPRTGRGKLDASALPPVPAGRPPLENPYVAPRDELERAVVAAWTDVLDVDPVGVYDDFSDLGGDSLAAVEVITRLDATLNRQVPPATFLDQPTAAGIAEVLRQHREHRFASPLLPLRSTGSRIPMFCVHGGGGEVLNYRRLTDQLSDDQPVYAFQPRGEGARRAHSSIPRIAARYVTELLQVQPEGPFVLAGYSFGGAVAFEMATQLAAADHPPALLVMFDTNAPTYVRRLIARHPARRLARRLQLDAMWVGWRLGLPDWRILRRLAERTRMPQWKWRRRISQLAMRRFRPSRYTASDVVLFRTTRDSEQPDLGWTPFVVGTLDIVAAAGTHRTMLDIPHIDGLSVVLDELLASVSGDASIATASPTRRRRG